MSDEVKEIKKTKNKLSKKIKLEELASQRLRKIKEEKEKTTQLKAEIMTEHKIKSEVRQKQLQRQAADVGRHGGGRKWPVWVVQTICEMLTNGAPPSSIPDLLRTMVETMNGDAAVIKLPSVRFVRMCCTVVQVLGETMVAIRLGRANFWQQLFTDGTFHARHRSKILS